MYFGGTKTGIFACFCG